MANFAEDLEEVAALEPITGVVIGEMGWKGYGVETKHLAGLARRGEILSWAEARPLLDYEYNTGLGAPDCQAVYAWTKTRVLFVVQYDGVTSVLSLPQKPMSCIPEMPGG